MDNQRKVDASASLNTAAGLVNLLPIMQQLTDEINVLASLIESPDKAAPEASFAAIDSSAKQCTCSIDYNKDVGKLVARLFLLEKKIGDTELALAKLTSESDEQRIAITDLTSQNIELNKLNDDLRAKEARLNQLEHLSSIIDAQSGDMELRSSAMKAGLAKFAANAKDMLLAISKTSSAAELDYKDFHSFVVSAGLFDEVWYMQMYGDNLPVVDDLLRHYLDDGHNTGYNPSRLFDGQEYLTRNSDVAAEGMNPLWHYVQFGLTEQRIFFGVTEQ